MCTDPISTGRPTPALMDVMIRDFNREAPGLSRKSASTIHAAKVAMRFFEEKILTAPSLGFRGISSNYPERSLPASLVEEMQHLVAQNEFQAVAPCGLEVLIVGSRKRPVDEHRPPNDIFLRDESPVAAVEAHAAVIAHGEIVIRRHDQILTLNVGRKIDSPVAPDVRVIVGRNRREVIAVGIRGPVSIVQDIRFIEGDAVAVHHAISEVNAVAGYADNPLDDIEAGRFRREEHNDVPEVHVSITNDRPDPVGLGSKLNSIDEDVVPDQEGIFHRTRRDFEGLHDEGNDEQSYDED